MYENHYHKKISSVYGDGPREIVNCTDDDYQIRYTSNPNSDTRSVMSHALKDSSVSRRSLKM